MWALDATYAWLDSIFRIRCNDDRLAEHVGSLLRVMEAKACTERPRATYSVRTADGGLELQRGEHRVAPVCPPKEVVDRLITELNRSALAAFGGFATHAGVVADGADAVALPAASGGGKSTLTAACVLTGLEYVSDEALCLTLDDRRVVAYPKPIGLSYWSRATLGLADADVSGGHDTYVATHELGGLVAAGNLRVTHVVLSEVRSGPPELVAARRSEALAALIELSFNHYKRPRQSFDLAARISGDCHTWSLRYGDPLAAAALLRTELTQ